MGPWALLSARRRRRARSRAQGNKLRLRRRRLDARLGACEMTRASLSLPPALLLRKNRPRERAILSRARLSVNYR